MENGKLERCKFFFCNVSKFDDCGTEMGGMKGKGKKNKQPENVDTKNNAFG